MKKIFITIFSFGICSAAGAQGYTSLSETFNTACSISTTDLPEYWTRFDLINNSSASDSGSWQCDPTDGRDGTPCVSASGYYAGIPNTDSCLLITPELNLASYANSVYLQFDTKTTFVSGERLSIVKYADTTLSVIDTGAARITMAPPISNADSTGWVTHQVDLTDYKSSPFFVGFLYTSSNSYVNKWNVDNVLLTTWPLSLNNVADKKIPMTVAGIPTTTEIKINYDVPSQGTYGLCIYDLAGHIVLSQSITTLAGMHSYTIGGLDLVPGMYCIRMNDDHFYGIVKTIIP